MFPFTAIALGLFPIWAPGFDPVLAATLLAAPPGSLAPDVTSDEWPGLRAAVMTAAVREELLDPRGEFDSQADCRLFDRSERFAENLDVLRERRFALAGAPPAGDALRFPSLTVLREGRDQYWKSRANINPRKGNLYFAAWSAALEARDPESSIPERRLALARLRRVIGIEAYHRAELPQLPAP